MFDPRNQQTNDHIPILDHVTTLNDTFVNWEPLKYKPKTSQNAMVQFRVQEMEDLNGRCCDESDHDSSPLWQNSPPDSPARYRSTRAQDIARGQWELMQMVKSMPESCYELSLKDLVEQPRLSESQEQCLIKNSSSTSTDQVVQQQKAKVKRLGSRNKNMDDDQIISKMMRSESIDNRGFFLKTFFPVPLGSKKNKKKSSPNSSTKVSPKPAAEGSDNNKTIKSVEKEWWKKRFSGSSESDDNGGTSSNSGSSGSSKTSNNHRKKKGLLTSCWSRLCCSKCISTV